MESIGEKLRSAREKNNYTIEQIARDTHVAKRFLKALEDEDFSVFPGETYAMGFLRNYAEYLGLNAEELIGLYRNLKIQEQPLPMIELLQPKPARNLRLIAAVVGAGIVILGACAFLVFKLVSAKPGTEVVHGQGASAAGQDFIFQEEVSTTWFTQGEGILVPVGDKKYRMELTAIGDTLTLKIPSGTADLTLGKERLIDLDGDSNADVKVVWNDVDRTSPQKRANLGLYRITSLQAETPEEGAGQTPGAPAGSAASAGAATAAGTAAVVVPAATSAASANIAATGAPGAAVAAAPATGASAQGTPIRAASGAQVSRGADAAPFTVDIVFRDYCLFRFQADSKEKEEKFFQKGESFSIEAKAKVTLWLSNAGAVKARILGKDVELGNAGEVAVRQIGWARDTAAGDYVLGITPLY
jgi:cytoskeleton protein RodZ